MSARPVALVTGASRGIGEAIARELAKAGYSLVLAARSADALHALAAELTRTGTPTLALPTDMQDPAALERLAQAALAQFGRVDVLVHNAGIGGSGRAFGRDERARDDAVLATNLHAPILLTRLLLPQFIERRSGTIIFIASVAAHLGFGGSTIYSTSKFGLRGFAEGLRRDLLRKNVRVVTISPGFIRTEMTTWIGWLPMPGPPVVGRAVVRAIRRPRRELVVPAWYRAFFWLDRVTPWFVDTALRVLRGK